jgi:hypothetical protein
MRATDVFTPNDYPAHTYVERGGEDLERRLRDAIDTPKAVISISGPSKSGKTVLVERVVGKDNLIEVSGAEIRSPDSLWERALDWMGAPSQTATQNTSTKSDQIAGQISGGAQIPLLARGDAQVSYQTTGAKANSTTTTVSRQGLVQVVNEIANSSYVLLIDDFHYMDREVQIDAAKQIKLAAERGVRICVASVPHRADDVVRSNPELRGRTTNIDTTFWSLSELEQIAVIGFDKLNARIISADAQRFAAESCGSPQLMQAICLQACYYLGLREQRALREDMQLLTDDQFKTILEITSSQSDHSSLVTHMHQGPKIRGVERKEYQFVDGTKGDVYRCVLLAIAQDPPRMGISYTQLMERVQSVCTREAPVGSSIKEACKQIVGFALNSYPDQRIVEFDDEIGIDTFSIVDPYWLFYLRSSTKLSSLGTRE